MYFNSFNKSEQTRSKHFKSDFNFKYKTLDGNDNEILQLTKQKIFRL